MFCFSHRHIILIDDVCIEWGQNNFFFLFSKEKQLRELADAMRTLTPEEALAQRYEEQARKAAEEAGRYNGETVARMREEMERAKAEKLRREEERKRTMQEKFEYVIQFFCSSYLSVSTDDRLCRVCQLGLTIKIEKKQKLYRGLHEN